MADFKDFDSWEDLSIERISRLQDELESGIITREQYEKITGELPPELIEREFAQSLEMDVGATQFEALGPVASGMRKLNIPSENLRLAAQKVIKEDYPELSKEAAEKNARKYLALMADAVAWESPSRALELSWVMLPREKAVSRSVKPPEKGLGFGLDVSQVDEFISKVSGMKLFTESDYDKVINRVFEKTALEQVKATIIDVLTDRFMEVSKDLESKYGFCTRYNQILLESISRINSLLGIVKAIESYLEGYKQEVTTRIQRIDRISGLRTEGELFETRFEQVLLVVESSIAFLVNLESQLSMIVADLENLTLQFSDIVRNKNIADFEFTSDVLGVLADISLRTKTLSDESTVIFGKIFDVSKMMASEPIVYSGKNPMRSIIEILWSIHTEINDFIVQGKSLMFGKLKNPDIKKMINIEKFKSSITKTDSIYKVESKRVGGTFTYMFSVLDNIDVSLKAIGADNNLIKNVRGIMSSLFDRTGLHGRLVELIQSSILKNMDETLV